MKPLDQPRRAPFSLGERMLVVGIVAALLVACAFVGALVVETW